MINLNKKTKLVSIVIIIIVLVISIIVILKNKQKDELSTKDEQTMISGSDLLAAIETIANYEEVEESIKETINNQLKDKLEEKSETAIQEKTLTVYPIGSIYISTSSTNPAEFIGGTWETYGQGRTLVGEGTNDEYTFTEGSTGTTVGATTNPLGEYAHTLTTDELPVHTHSVTAKGTVASTFTGAAVTTSSDGAHTHTVSGSAASAGSHTHSFSDGTGKAIVLGSTSSLTKSDYGFQNTSGIYCWFYGHNKNKTSIASAGAHTHSVSGTAASAGAHTHTITPTGTVSSTFTGSAVTSSAAGGAEAHNNIQPYIVTYMWKRTA